jgi:hypothetical protein
VIIRGNQELAQAYALHINGVYDHYSWRAYLHSGGDPNQIFKPLDGWKPGGSREQELSFWMGAPIPSQKAKTSNKRKGSAVKKRKRVTPTIAHGKKKKLQRLARPKK